MRHAQRLYGPLDLSEYTRGQCVSYLAHAQPVGLRMLHDTQYDHDTGECTLSGTTPAIEIVVGVSFILNIPVDGIEWRRDQLSQPEPIIARHLLAQSPSVGCRR